MQRKQLITIKSLLISIAIAVAVISIGCATSAGRLPPPEQLMSQNSAGQSNDPAALKRGRALVVTECAACHRFYWPDEYSPQEWEKIIRKMGKLASLSESQVEDIQTYMKAATEGRHAGTGAVSR
jgi:mono/diheme cytochrome c family protein